MPLIMDLCKGMRAPLGVAVLPGEGSDFDENADDFTLKSLATEAH